ncbi:MAG: amidohydrolase [Candidatus Melainabacteria bacterium]|nr:amidohydrolase [Candidatus Melainabacteria bacterium]
MVTVSYAKLSDKLVSIRRDLHRFPELGWREERTTEKICEVLDELKIPHRRLPGLTGVIADIPGTEGVPVVALRADIDALPIHEETNLEFASSIEGNMHACGHDGHVSMLLGAAEILASESALPAPVRLLFQPAEELGAGALKMIEHGALKDVGMIFGGHIDRHFKAGVIAVTDGVVNASADKFVIDITGKGGHAARPHETVDAVIAGSLLVIALQTIVSREVNPAHPSVVTVGKFEAGTASNVIAGRCHMEGTIRTQDDEVRRHLHEALFRMAQSVGQLHGATIDCRIVESLPVLTNTLAATDIARRAAAAVVGSKRVEAMATANMGGEDFSFYIHEVPGCYVRFGGQVEGCVFPAHSSKFVFDEACLLVGAQYLAEVAKTAGETLRVG